MKILYISALYPPHVGGGAELVLESQAQEMAARGHQVTVLTIGPDPGVVTERRDNVSVLRAEYHNEYFHLSHSRPSVFKRLKWHVHDRDNSEMARVARELLPELAPDIACCHNLAGWSISIWRELKQLGIPVVQVLHDSYLLCAKSTMFRNGRNCRSQCLDCKLLRRDHAEASNQVDAVVGVSRFILQRLVGNGLFRNVSIRQVIHNVGRGQMPAVPAPRPLRSGELTLGYIGTLAENKGIGACLEQLEDAGFPNVRMRIAGRGLPGFEEPLRRVFEGGSMEFLGYIHPKEFFPTIDALIVPSLWDDTLPSVVFESLAYGVPVIASRRGGIPEMVSDGVNGLLYEPEHSHELPDTLQRLLTLPSFLTALAANCRASAAPFYDHEARTNIEEQLFNNVIAQAGTTRVRTA